MRPAEAARADVVWRDGKTRFTLGKNFYMEMSNRIQPRFTLEMPDDSVKLARHGGSRRHQGQLPHPARQVQARGLVLQAGARVRGPAQLARTPTTRPPARFLEDANIDWDISKKKIFRVRFGQFKAPYGRQQLTSSGAQQFVDRAHRTRATTRAARPGIALWGTLGGNKLDWRVMMSNGNGRTQDANDNDKFL